MAELVLDIPDPALAYEVLPTLSGLDYLRRVLRRELPQPPIAALLGMEATVVEPGRVVFRADPGPQHLNPIGLVHGGLLATLLDSVTGCAVHTELDAGVGYATGDLHVRYLRPSTPGTPVEAVGEVVHVGRRTASAQGRVTDAEGRLLATATAGCQLLR